MSKQNKKIFHPENEPSSFDQEGALLKFWRENQRITVRDVMTEDELFLCLLNVSQQKTGNAFPIFRTFPPPSPPVYTPYFSWSPLPARSWAEFIPREKDG